MQKIHVMFQIKSLAVFCPYSENSSKVEIKSNELNSLVEGSSRWDKTNTVVCSLLPTLDNQIHSERKPQAD